MTYNELRAKFIKDYTFIGQNPLKFEVDAETYGLAVQGIINEELDYQCSMGRPFGNGYRFIEITVGPNHGIQFFGTELVIAKDKDAKGK